jgi:hypothetical protein
MKDELFPEGCWTTLLCMATVDRGITHLKIVKRTVNHNDKKDHNSILVPPCCSENDKSVQLPSWGTAGWTMPVTGIVPM